MFDVAAWILSIILIIRGFITAYFLKNSLNWFKNKQNLRKKLQNSGDLPIVTFIIPALREQARIISTLNYFIKSFAKYPVKIIVATTQREYEKPFEGISTKDLVINYISLNKLENTITVIDYPFRDGRKAHQLNYVLKEIKNKTDFIAVYDADSRPHSSTLEAFYAQIQENADADVFQQSAIFFKNIDEPLDNINWFKKTFLKSSAVLQTRWTFAHEVARFLRQSGENKFLCRYSNAHCVGHGLFIRLNTIEKIGGFPENTINEDSILGYFFRIKGIKINPLLYLEMADAPITIKGLWSQKYVWFWGPLRYPEYYKIACENFSLCVREKIIAIILSAQGILSAFAWLFSGPIVLLALICALITNNSLTRIALITGLIIYGPLQFVIVSKNIELFVRCTGYNIKRMKPKEIVGISLMSIPAIIFHSIPPYFTLVTEARHILFKKKIFKPKTDD